MNTAIIGGGFAGMIAAIVSSQNGDEVTIFEHMPRMGKKLLLTGSGKCNISNTDMDISHFHASDEGLVARVLSKCPPEDTLDFFEKLGLVIKDRNGYLYPYSEQASAVLDVLRFAIRDMGVDVLTDTDIRSVVKIEQGSEREVEDKFVVVTNQGRYSFDKVIICTGSSANRNTGSDGSGYDLVKAFGHTIVKPLPALTSLTCEDTFFPSIAGIRTRADVRLYDVTHDEKAGDFLGHETGELQLVKSGISGIPVFNLSFMAVRALDEGKKIRAVIDLMPDMPDAELTSMLTDRLANIPDRSLEEMFIGILAKPLGICICKRCGLDLRRKCSSLNEKEIKELSVAVKSFDATVTGSGGLDNSQVAQGGVSLSEVTDDLESRHVSNLFFAGEILDVNGDCGGYNLQWAASSAMVAANGPRDQRGRR